VQLPYCQVTGYSYNTATQQVSHWVHFPHCNLLAQSLLAVPTLQPISQVNGCISLIATQQVSHWMQFPYCQLNYSLYWQSTFLSMSCSQMKHLLGKYKMRSCTNVSLPPIAPAMQVPQCLLGHQLFSSVCSAASLCHFFKDGSNDLISVSDLNSSGSLGVREYSCKLSLVVFE
jgi:hypothetical protein